MKPYFKSAIFQKTAKPDTRRKKSILEYINKNIMKRNVEICYICEKFSFHTYIAN